MVGSASTSPLPGGGLRAYIWGVDSANSPDRAIRLELLVVLALEVALVVALHLSGGNDYTVPLRSLGDWFASADATVVLVAVARLVALVIGYWLLTTTVLYAAAHHLGWGSVAGVLQWITLPFVRRIVQGVTAASLTGASLMGPATVAVAPVLAETTEVAQGDAGGEGDEENGEGTDDGEELPDTSGVPVDAAGWPDLGTDGGFWRPGELPQIANNTEGTHTVVASDHLWKIAEDHLQQTVGRAVTEDEVCLYWLRVIDANKDSIQSGDPDLIYPQETIKLPPVFTE